MNSLERKVLELIGEDADAPDVFVDTDEGLEPIRDSINDAIQEINVLTGGNKQQYYVPLRAGQMFYRFSPSNGHFGWVADCWDVTRKIRLEQTDLIRLSAFDPRWMVGSGFPESYIQLGTDVVGFYKKPASSANVIEMTIVEIPDAYKTDTDRIKLKDSFSYACVQYAVAEFWASRGDAIEAASHMGLYLEALGLRERFLPSRESTNALRTDKEPWPVVTQ